MSNSLVKNDLASDEMLDSSTIVTPILALLSFFQQAATAKRFAAGSSEKGSSRLAMGLSATTEASPWSSVSS